MLEEVRNQDVDQNQENATNELENGNIGEQQNVPITEEIMAKAAQAEAEAKKWKNEFDRLSSQVASMKKTIQSLREFQTAEQRKASEDQEAKEALEAEHARLQDFERRTLAKERYLMQGMSVEMASKAADAEVSGNMDELANIQKQHTESTLKSARAEWQKSIPQPQFGTGEYSSMSKEEIKNIKDRSERRKAIAQNMNLFQRG